MRRLLKRGTAFLLAVCIAALTGCANDSSGVKNTAMGRYLEEQVSAPEEMGAFVKAFYQLPDGTIEMLANRDRKTGMGPYQFLRSEDGGRTWQTKDTPWMRELGDGAVVNAATPDGKDGMYVLYQNISDEYMEALNKFDPEQASLHKPEVVFVHVDENGNVERLPYTAPIGKYGDEASDMRVAANGDIVLNTGFHLIQIDSKTGETKNTYEPDGSAYDSFLVFENTMAVSVGENILLFNLETGEQSGSISCTNTSTSDGEQIFYDGSPQIPRVMAMNEDNTAIYFADRNGIYRHLLDGSVLEQLASGELTSLNMPSVTPTEMLKVGEDFLILANTESKLNFLRYHYDQTVPSVPNTELKVYSLLENKTIRQAMGMFQRSHPDVHVTYQVGLSSDSVNVSDALRLLSTELLAGKGPDILVLDGIPIDSYVEKGVLADLSTLTNKYVGEGAWMENVANTFKKEDGKTYAIPARFKIPSILGTQDVIDANERGMDALIETIIKDENGKELKPENIISQAMHPVSALRLFYPVSAPNWLNEDGTIKESELSSFLENIKKLVGNYPDMWGGSDVPEYTFSEMTFSALLWSAKGQRAAVGDIQSMENLAPPDAAIKQRNEGVLVPLKGQAGAVYVPSTILGINASGNQKELAQSFVELTLSQELQVSNFEDGIPVNLEALKENAKSPYAGTPDDGSIYSYSYTDEDGVDQMSVLSVLWPSNEFIQAQIESYKGLKTASVTDSVVRQMVIDESWDYFLEKKSLENTVTAISEKVRLYLSER